MKYLPTSRRMFLGGAGVTLALPLLPSLLPRHARAELSTSPVRYIQVLNPYGPNMPIFFGPTKPDQQIAPNVRAKALTEIRGDISPIFNAAFDPYRSRMSLLLGLDVMAANANHHYVFPTCATSYASGVDNDEAPPLSGQSSVDTLMAQSSKVYGDDVSDVRRVVNINPVTTDDYSNNRSFSWRSAGEGPKMVRPVKETQGVLDPFIAGFEPSEDVDPREKQLMAAVHGDYQRVRDGGKISGEDKQRLESYMALIDDIVKGFDVVNVCDSPDQVDEADIEKTIDNQYRILAAAMACGMTRIGSITLGMSQGYGSRHDQHHALFGKTESPIIDDFKQNGARVARLLAMLDAVIESDGSLLDNSLVYWCMQYGCVKVDGQHNAANMPVFVAGGAGGRLKQGHLIDYRLGPDGRGLVMNNLLVTFMNCMGMSSADYESDPGGGYGFYKDDWTDRPDPEFWSSTEGHRAPLPVIYQGPVMG